MDKKKIKIKSHHRKSYTRKDGTKVKATTVKAHYIKKQGLTTGKKNLIPIKDTRHLKKFGYSFNKKSSERHQALDKAVKKYGKNWGIHRLTALANIRPKTKKYEKIIKKARRDVKYIQGLRA